MMDTSDFLKAWLDWFEYHGWLESTTVAAAPPYPLTDNNYNYTNNNYTNNNYNYTNNNNYNNNC